MGCILGLRNTMPACHNGGVVGCLSIDIEVLRHITQPAVVPYVSQYH